MLISLRFDGDAATSKTNWFDWPGGLHQMHLIGDFDGATVKAVHTFEDLDGQEDPSGSDHVRDLDDQSLTASGKTAPIELVRGGKVRYEKSGAGGSCLVRGSAGVCAHPRANASRGLSGTAVPDAE